MSLRAGKRKRAHGRFGAHVEEDAKHRQEEDGFDEQAEAGTDAGRHIGLGFLHLHQQHAHERDGHEDEEEREGAAPTHACEEGDRGHRRHQVSRGVLPSPLMPWAKARLRL